MLVPESGERRLGSETSFEGGRLSLVIEATEADSVSFFDRVL
jgi:hypothetical protein